MDNYFRLVATLHTVDTLRYTPAGVPVIDVVLAHESWQEENSTPCCVKFELPAKILGNHAKIWQHKQGCLVEAIGFLAQRSQKTTRPVLRIQSIQELKQDNKG